ncbi:MAG: hypothetical protein IPK82_14075 [Polyangiaceae bacterium]|nr:hypothetical protein [Polyangiaceae bacterium]
MSRSHGMVMGNNIENGGYTSTITMFNEHCGYGYPITQFVMNERVSANPKTPKAAWFP